MFAPSIFTPCAALPRAADPDQSVPIKLPCTVIPGALLMDRPSLPLPPITFPARAVVPPIVLLGAFPMLIPSFTLPRFAVALTFVPIKLPCTILPSALLLTAIPVLFPEIRFRANGIGPPMVLLSPPSIQIPAERLPRVAVPVTSVPIKLPCTILLWLVLPWIYRPTDPLPEIRFLAPGAQPPMMLLLEYSTLIP